MLAQSCVAGLKKFGTTTAEHEVYHRPSDNRALKITYPGTFGVTPEPKGVQKAATPAFYLQRLELMNEVFRSDFRLEGVLMGKSLLLGAKEEQPSFVVSQPWMSAADGKNPYPTAMEIAEFMGKAGFTAKANSYYGWEKGNLTIIDARPDNFIKTSEGVVPIDLVICKN